MFINEPAAQEILDRISNEGHFKELILTPDGSLFVDPARETKADEFRIYYQSVVYLPGSLYTNCSGKLCALGDPLSRDLRIPLMKNKSEVAFDKHGNCYISSKRAGIPTGSSLIAYFRYQRKAVLIIAGDVDKRRSRTFIVEATEENNELLASVFVQYLQHVNPELTSQLADSDAAMKVDQQLLPDTLHKCN